MKAFAQMNTDSDTVSIPANTAAVVPMPTAVAASDNMTIASSTITVKDEGYYVLTYALYPTFSATAPTILTFAVRGNGENIDQTVSFASAPATTFDTSYTGSTIEKIPAGTKIDIAVHSTAPVTMSFNSNAISSLFLFKVD